MIATDRLWLDRGRIQCALNCPDAEAGFSSDLGCDALGAMPSAILALTFNRDSLTRLNFGASCDQFRIAPNVFIPLFLGQVQPMQVLGDLPKLGGMIERGEEPTKVPGAILTRSLLRLAPIRSFRGGWRSA